MTSKVPPDVAALLERAGFALIERQPLRAGRLLRLMSAGFEMLESDDPRDREDAAVLAAGLAALADELAPSPAALAEGALDAACRSVQDRLGVPSCDTAGHCFAASLTDPAIERLIDYAKTELAQAEARERETAGDAKDGAA